MAEMRVLQVMASGASGGGAEHLLGLMPALARRGVACDAAVGDDGPLRGQLSDMGFTTWPLHLMASRIDPRGPLRVAHILRRCLPDTAHWHGTRAAFYGGLSQRLHPVPSVYTVHGLSHNRRANPLTTWILRNAERIACASADLVVSVSHADLTDLRQQGFTADKPTLHLPNAVDTKRFCPRLQHEARRQLDLPDTGFVVGTVSRLVPQKSVDIFLEAVRQLPDVTALVVGSGSSEADLRRRFGDLGQRVRFLGARDDIPLCLNALDVFVLSSSWEGQPIALLEALASGVPCVATETAGSRETLEGGALGRLVPIGNAAELATAIRQLSHDTVDRQQMTQRGRTAMIARSYDAAASEIATAYRRLHA
jgi:glycosyltransferase involved in cell wall biosynthesis